MLKLLFKDISTSFAISPIVAIDKRLILNYWENFSTTFPLLVLAIGIKGDD